MAILFTLILINLLIFGCFNQNNVDIERLTLLRGTYNGKFDFELSNDGLYLYAKAKKSSKVTDGDLMQIYYVFFFNDVSGRRRETSFVYLNFYDDGEFKFQIYCNNKGDCSRSQTEHY